MRIYVKEDNSFHQQEPVSKECPHCGAVAQLLPMSTPSFNELTRSRPRFVGLGLRCAACNEPRFVRVATRSFGPERIELSSHMVEVERPREQFAFTHLPPRAARLFREALDCYTAHCHLAFGTMCRKTLQAAVQTDEDRRRFSQLFDEAIVYGNVETTTARVLREALLGLGDVPDLTPGHSAVLIEIIKDMLYQRYVRTAKLQAALNMRRHFAGDEPPNVTPFSDRQAESA